MDRVAGISYKPGWKFRLGGPGNRYLCIHTITPDSLHPSRTRPTQHMFALPATDDEREFVRWVFARILDAERHEAAEFFRVDGRAPFWPHHQDEGSPYEHVERWETP